MSPLNYLDPDFPISAASLVLAKSRGYTKDKEQAPAAPPESKLPMKKEKGETLGSKGQKNFWNLLLKAKLRA